MKRKLMKKVIMLTVLILVGCATSWVGKNVTELIEVRGEPTCTIEDGKGGQVLIYTSRKGYTDPGGFSSSPGPTGYYKDGKYVYIPRTKVYREPSRTTVSKEWQFYVDSAGTIYRAEYDRNTYTRKLRNY